MNKPTIAASRIGRIDDALASMQRAAKQARERIDDLTWPDISNLERIAKEIEAAEWFWSGVNDMPPTEDGAPVTYIDKASGAEVQIVHVEWPTAYLSNGMQQALSSLRLRRYTSRANRARRKSDDS